tara:strand:+ start:3324 stop:3722 length:399 start_codon:yes stop_codon:yes gene_type:complete
MNNRNLTYDKIGVISSTLCMIHCIITPFIFLAKVCTISCCSDAPVWWQIIDYLFLGISFVAVYYTTKDRSLDWLKISFWITWFILLITIVNHTLEIIYLNPNLIYIPAFLIIMLHLYNMHFHKCHNKNCCPK